MDRWERVSCSVSIPRRAMNTSCVGPDQPALRESSRTTKTVAATLSHHPSCTAAATGLHATRMAKSPGAARSSSASRPAARHLLMLAQPGDV